MFAPQIPIFIRYTFYVLGGISAGSNIAAGATADMFDFIFSQQVVEHVDDDYIEAFLDEEVRVLSESGIVYHQIPHRWTPWESTRRPG